MTSHEQLKQIAPNFRLVLYQPEIPANTGNISRLCVGTNCELVLVGKLGFALDDKRAKRAGLDHWQQLHYRHEPSLSPLLNGRYHLISRYGSRPLWDCRLERGDTVIFGSETGGLPEAVLRENADHSYYLPLYGPARSLNLSNAVAIVVYEGLRQLNERNIIATAPPLTDSQLREYFDSGPS